MRTYKPRQGGSSEARAAVVQRTDAEWLAALNAIPDAQIRAQAGSIAWWETQAPALAPCLRSYALGRAWDTHALYSALITLGMPEPFAADRSRQPLTDGSTDARRMRVTRTLAGCVASQPRCTPDVLAIEARAALDADKVHAFASRPEYAAEFVFYRAMRNGRIPLCQDRAINAAAIQDIVARMTMEASEKLTGGGIGSPG